MSEFNEAVSKLIDNYEKEYSNRASDIGGETKYGISKKAYPHLDIKNLTREQAEDIYRRDYWRNYGGINSQCVAEKVFNISVNCGQETANHMLQRALSKCGHDVRRDGICGMQTIAATNSANEYWLLAELQLELVYHYCMIARKDKSQLENICGWLKRALEPTFIFMGW